MTMTKNTMTKTYSEMIKFQSYIDRYNYLRLTGIIGEETFGYNRYLNQILYKSSEWRNIRHSVIVRDCGRDLAHEDHAISGKVIVHHINPITRSDILNRDPKIFDMENLVTVSHNTHEAIHFGSEAILPRGFVERCPNDTRPWRC